VGPNHSLSANPAEWPKPYRHATDPRAEARGSATGPGEDLDLTGHHTVQPTGKVTVNGGATVPFQAASVDASR